jgi:hypothetical protein
LVRCHHCVVAPVFRFVRCPVCARRTGLLIRQNRTLTCFLRRAVNLGFLFCGLAILPPFKGHFPLWRQK